MLGSNPTQTERDFEQRWNEKQRRKRIKNLIISIVAIVGIGIFGGAVVEQVQRLDGAISPLPLFCGSLVIFLIVLGIILAVSDKAKR